LEKPTPSVSLSYNSYSIDKDIPEYHFQGLILIGKTGIGSFFTGIKERKSEQ